tara:strand:+ start:23128 stop:23268 length:141 start_codon:yes stop_codon:yes gene_type:complete
MVFQRYQSLENQIFAEVHLIFDHPVTGSGKLVRQCFSGHVYFRLIL